MWKLQPPAPWKKSPPPLPQQPPSKTWGLDKPPPFLKIGLEAQSPPNPAERGGGAHYETVEPMVTIPLQELKLKTKAEINASTLWRTGKKNWEIY